MRKIIKATIERKGTRGSHAENDNGEVDDSEVTGLAYAESKKFLRWREEWTLWRLTTAATVTNVLNHGLRLNRLRLSRERYLPGLKQAVATSRLASEGCLMMLVRCMGFASVSEDTEADGYHNGIDA